MSWVRDRLLKELPDSFDKHSHPAPGISITYDGAAFVTIFRQELRIHVEGGTGSDLAISLAGKTLTALATEIDMAVGYDATVSSTDGALPAISLIEVNNYPLTDGSLFYCFTSLLWRVLLPISWVLYEGIDIQEQAAQQSASVWSAEGAWLDYWGELYGNARRRISESDMTFAVRIMRELLRPKLNALALEDIIAEDLGVQARITNLHKKAWEVGTTRKGYIAGRKFSRTTFEVLLSDLVTGVETVIEKNKAAGTVPYYRYQMSQGDVEVGEMTIAPTFGYTVPLRSRHGLMVGDPCGSLPLGGKWFSIFEQFGLAPKIEYYLNVTGGLAGPMVLGTGILGTNVLGDVSEAGVIFTQGNSQAGEV